MFDSSGNKSKSGVNKRKLPEEYENIVNKRPNIQPVETSGNYPILKPILDFEYGSNIEIEKYFVGKIIIKKETSRLIKELSVKFPLEGKSFLKRVKWTNEKNVFEILIHPLNSKETVESTETFTVDEVLRNCNINTTGLSNEVVIRDIPKYPAKTCDQFKEASKFWSVQFREDKYLERLLKDEAFTLQEKADIEMYMQLCFSASKYGDEKVGCVVVDPCSSKIVAISHDRRHHHPIQHAVMVAADLVAKGQGGGSWDIPSNHAYHLPYTPDEQSERITKCKDTAKKMNLPYLCTGYDLYVSREPCVMCAMALVHSRIRRVFYVRETPWGALGSHWKLHLQNGLNHHYEVFKVCLNNSDQQS